jgi:hypothetical protein
VALEPTRVSPFEKLDDQQLAHPFDTHPRCAVRLEAYGIARDRVIGDASEIPPVSPAIRLISGAERIEEKLTVAYCERFH